MSPPRKPLPSHPFGPMGAFHEAAQQRREEALQRMLEEGKAQLATCTSSPACRSLVHQLSCPMAGL